MDWIALTIPLSLLLLVLGALLRRRVELREIGENLTERAVAKQRGSDRARLQHPKVDLDNCIGCGACVRACPEDGVLALAFGQAVVVHGARCVGHGLCAAACPTNAIALTLGDLKQRKDLPAVDDGLEAVGVPGLFLAGEITGFALVRTAVGHGAMVGNSVAARCAAAGPRPHGGQVHDLLVVGLGPAGLACMLAAKAKGLDCVGIDQASEIGGTVAAYPRQKLVMTQPMELPLHGRLTRLEYEKEELIELWQELATKHRLAVRCGVTMQGLARGADGVFVVETSSGRVRARNVCLAVGRRGSPQKLSVPGEELPKVAYALLDAESHRDRQVLVVGGGDSAIEAALALAEQPGNCVTLSYRRPDFSRLKARNEQRIRDAITRGVVDVRFCTVVERITPEAVFLCASKEANGGGGVATAVSELPNDEVFVFAGGTPPFPLLEAAGVSFDPSLRPEEVAVDRGTGLLVALGATAVAALLLLLVRQAFHDYYDLPVALRSGSDLHLRLRPQGPLGLYAGVVAVTMFLVNLLYLARRSSGFGRLLPGTLKSWMSLHVATGLCAGLFAVLHSGFALRDGPGGHALIAMVVVVGAGVVGRWFYAFVPRSQNGRQQDLEELGSKVAAIAGEWDRDGRGFGGEVRARVEALVDHARMGQGFVARVLGLVRSLWQLRRSLTTMRRQAASEGVPTREVHRLVSLAKRSHRLAMQLSHFEEVRGILSAWRWMHRWLALLLLLLTVVHVADALRFGGVDFGVLLGGGVR
ncbi:MAG: NAD(P)-binding domain-containing protein [Planctomycetes bacterium]|nr:NAD(P)-binding domain-containing protein [Planctomycetota bacterium]